MFLAVLGLHCCAPAFSSCGKQGLLFVAVHGILQARILEWVVFPFSRGLPNPGIKPRFPALQSDSLRAEPQGKSENTGVGSLALLQGIFPTQESNWGLLHCRRILYQLSYEGSLVKVYLFYFWLCWVFTAAHPLSLAWQAGTAPCWGAWASHCGGLRVAGHGLSGMWAQLWLPGSRAQAR